MGDQMAAAHKLGIENLEPLPTQVQRLVGRGRVCGLLAGALASDKIAVAGITAPGGTGKSVLVRGWLEDPDEAASRPGRVLACKFTDVSRQTTASSNPFINAFLAAEVTGSEDRKAQQLLQRFREVPTILVLDSLEALQEQGRDGKGRIEDEAIRRFLVQSASRGEGNAGSLIIVTSRERLPDLQGLDGFQRIKLKPLDVVDGAKLLAHLGVKGPEKDLKEASQDFGGNPLALVLLAGLIRAHTDSNTASVHQEIRIFEREHAANPRELEQAERILRYYQGRGLGKPGEQVLLRMMGLFHRPMQRDERDALLNQAAFAADLKDWKEEWAKVHDRLADLGLLSTAGKDSGDEGADGEVADEQAAEDIRDEWDCHPLVREHFRERFSVEEPEQWRQAQGVLFGYFQAKPATDLPKTREEMVPLYRAIHHGCWAHRYREALSVYKDRIMQGLLSDHGANELGAISEDSAALRMFFEPEKTELKSGVLEQLEVPEQAWLHARTAFCLTSLGRLKEAIHHREAELEYCKLQERAPDLWGDARTELYKNTANAAGMLSALQLLVGRIEEAKASARRAIDWADRSEDPGQRARARCRLGAALHMAGAVGEAWGCFENAVAIHQANDPRHPDLNSDHGFFFRLLQIDASDGADYQYLLDILHEAERALDFDERDLDHRWLVALALGRLAKAMIKTRMAERGGKQEDILGASWLLDEAEHLLIDSGTVIHRPQYDLAQARFAMSQDMSNEALRHVEMALRDAEAYRMPLYQVDALLFEAEILQKSQGPDRGREDLKRGNDALDRAARLIDEHDYGRGRIALDRLRDAVLKH